PLPAVVPRCPPGRMVRVPPLPRAAEPPARPRTRGLGPRLPAEVHRGRPAADPVGTCLAAAPAACRRAITPRARLRADPAAACPAAAAPCRRAIIPMATHQAGPAATCPAAAAPCRRAITPTATHRADLAATCLAAAAAAG